MKKYTQDDIKAIQHLGFVNTGSKMKRLSKAQYKIFELAALGLSNKQIAKLLLKSENTIKTHLKEILKQTGIGCRGAFWMYLPAEQRVGLGNDREAMAIMPVEKARNKDSNKTPKQIAETIGYDGVEALTASVAVEPVVIAPEVLDVVRFLAETWAEVDAFVYKHCDGEALMHYPVVQGTRNQIKLKKIGGQQYDPSRLKAGVDWLLAHNPTINWLR